MDHLNRLSLPEFELSRPKILEKDDSMSTSTIFTSNLVRSTEQRITVENSSLCLLSDLRFGREPKAAGLPFHQINYPRTDLLRLMSAEPAIASRQRRFQIS